jgi:iron uptake system component EfeO
MKRIPVHATLIVAAIFVVAFAIAGCGSSDEGTASSKGGGASRDVSNEEAPKAKEGANESPEMRKANVIYRERLEEDTGELIEEVKSFVAAVEAGDLEEAKLLYPEARVPYARIKPVVESIDDLDVRMDAQEDEVSADEFSGYHRIEKALWDEETTDDMGSVAEQLLGDAEEVQDAVKTIELRAVQTANRSNELLHEALTTTTNDDVEPYSHTDLVDVRADIEGSGRAYEAVASLYAEAAPNQGDEIEEGFNEVYEQLKKYRGEGTNDYIPYPQLTQAQIQKLAHQINALAKEMAPIPAKIVG